MALQAKFSVNVKPRRLDINSGVPTMIGAEYYGMYCSEANWAYADKVGFTPTPSMVPSLVRMESVYSSPLMVGEELTISVQTTRLGNSSFNQELQFTESKSGRPIASIVQVWVMMNPQTGRSTALPEELKGKLIAFEGKENVEVAGR